MFARQVACSHETNVESCAVKILELLVMRTTTSPYKTTGIICSSSYCAVRKFGLAMMRVSKPLLLCKRDFLYQQRLFGWNTCQLRYVPLLSGRGGYIRVWLSREHLFICTIKLSTRINSAAHPRPPPPSSAISRSRQS